MRLANREIRVFDTLPSTQDEAASIAADTDGYVSVLALHQSEGRGRFGRPWSTVAGASLALSIPLPDYAGHPSPWLIGMSVATAAASATRCQLQWPNDVVHKGKKVGGILTEIKQTGDLALPIVGIGVNLTEAAYPTDLAGSASSLASLRSAPPTPLAFARTLLEFIEDAPEPDSWDDIEPVWRLFDATPGKKYTTPTGELAVAIGVGPNGALIASVSGETTAILAATALFEGEAAD